MTYQVEFETDLRAPVYAGDRFIMRVSGSEMIQSVDGGGVIQAISNYALPIPSGGLAVVCKFAADLDEGDQVEITITDAMDEETIAALQIPALPVAPGTPNWTTDPQVDLEFVTRITQLEDGTEQRMSLTSAPRRSVRYKTLSAKARRPEMDAFLNRGADVEILAPDFRVFTPAESISGTTVLADVSELSVSDRVAVEFEHGLCAARVNAGLTSVELDEPAAGDPIRVVSVVPSIRDSGISETFRSMHVSDVDLRFLELPGRSPLSVTPSADPELDLFDFEPNYASDPRREIDTDIMIADVGHGRVIPSTDVRRRSLIYSQTHVGVGIEGLRLQNFIERQGGRLRAFYMHTPNLSFENYCTAITPDASVSDTVHITMRTDADVDVHIGKICSVGRVDGSSVFGTLSAISPVSGGVSVMLTSCRTTSGGLSVPIEYGAPLRPVTKVRFAQDTFSFKYVSGNVFTTQLNMFVLDS